MLSSLISYPFFIPTHVMPALPFIALLSICIAIYHFRNTQKSSFPPGPPFLSFLSSGPTRDIMRSPKTFADSLDTLCNTYGAIFPLWVGPSRVLVTSVPADIIHISSDPHIFPRTPKLQYVFGLIAPGGLFSMSYAPHRIARRNLRDRFNHSMLSGFHQAMSRSAAELCASLEVAVRKQETVDISAQLSAMSLSVILNVAFGTEMRRQERNRFANDVSLLTEELMSEMVNQPFRRLFASFGSRNRMMQCKDRLYASCNEFISKRLKETKTQKEARQSDILDSLLDLQGHSDEDLVAIVLEFAVAGYHSVGTAIIWSMLETCSSPRIEAILHKELDEKCGRRPSQMPLTKEDVESLSYLKNVWKETLRLHPPGANILRLAEEDITLRGSGVHVPKGTEIYGNIRNCHRNPAVWKDPLIFKPERWGSVENSIAVERVPAGAYNPFGMGQLNCAGRFLAEYEGPLVLAEMHRRFKFTLACNPSEVKNFSTIVETPRFVDKETGANSGVPMLVARRQS